LWADICVLHISFLILHSAATRPVLFSNEKYEMQDAKSRLAQALAGMALFGSLAGCGAGLQPVRGKVTLPDGKPAAGSQVVFEGTEAGKKVSARGDVGPDGSYVMSTFKPGDGVPPGKYKVQVNPPPMVNAEGPYVSPFHAKYSNLETSGLEFEVKRGGTNDFPIQVTK
jgi:hypothetical protein